MEKIRRLRLLFVLYFFLIILVDCLLGKDVILHALESYPVSPALLSVSIFIIYALLFVLGLLLFHQLTMKKNWARIILLMIGWLTIISALFGMMFAPTISRFVAHIDKFLDWDQILLIDRIKDIAGLIFWGYVLFLLQFNKNVKRECFLEPDEKHP